MFITLPLRMLQLIFAGIVFGLSAVLVHGYGPGHAPSVFAYGVFCGVLAMIGSIIGVVATFLGALQGIIMLAADFVASVVLIIGAIAFSAKFGFGGCINLSYLASIINTIEIGEYYVGDSGGIISHRCRGIQADEAFLWILVICFLATAVPGFLGRSGNRGGIKY